MEATWEWKRRLLVEVAERFELSPLFPGQFSALDDSVQPERGAFGDLRFHQLVHLVQLLFVMRSQITFLADIVRNAVELTAASGSR